MRTGLDFPRSRCRRGARWMRALTQDLADIPDRENSEKTGDVRTSCERGPLAFVQLGHVIDRHVRFSGQSFASSLVRGALARRRGRGKFVHGSALLAVRAFPYCAARLQKQVFCRRTFLLTVGCHECSEKPLEPAVCFRPHTPFPRPFVPPYPATPGTRRHLGPRGRCVLERLATLWAAHTGRVPHGLLALCGTLGAERPSSA
jgi:hypothetical protein